MTHLGDFFQLPRFPPSVGETFSGKQTTKPMLQSLYFPAVVSLGALTSATYSSRLCRDSCHSTATKPPSPICLHPSCFPSSSPLCFFQDSHISQPPSSLLPPHPLLLLPISPPAPHFPSSSSPGLPVSPAPLPEFSC